MSMRHIHHPDIDSYVWVIAAYHLSVGNLMTQAVCWLVWIYRHVQDIRWMAQSRRVRLTATANSPG